MGPLAWILQALERAAEISYKTYSGLPPDMS